MTKRKQWVAVCAVGVLGAAIISYLALRDRPFTQPPQESVPTGTVASSTQQTPPPTEPPVHICEFIYHSTQQPTCTAEGKQIFRCVCGLEREETIPVIPHSYVYDHTVDATCTAEGQKV